MIMNYDIITLIEFFIGSYICILGMFFTGAITYYKKIRNLKFYYYLLLIIAAVLLVCNTLLLDNIAKVFGTWLILFAMFKFTYKSRVIDTIIGATIVYFITALTEIVFAITFSLIDEILSLNIMQNSIGSLVANFFIAGLSCLFAFLFRKKIYRFAMAFNRENMFYFILIGFATIVVIIATTYKLSLNNWKIDYAFILNIFIVMACLTLSMILLRQYRNNKDLINKYKLLEDYMKTSAELIEKYSSTVHKYKNNLIVLKGYMKSDEREANIYIDSLLDKFENKKYSWFAKINKISLAPIRNLFYYKLSKAEELNLKISVDVSDDVKKLKHFKLNMYKTNLLLEIIGEYFDNAIYASAESKEKELNLVLYASKENCVFVLTNTYETAFDINLITKNGYTSKGKGHGFGLYDVDKFLKNNKFIKVNYEAIDNNFVVTLNIELENDSKNKIIRRLKRKNIKNNRKN